MKKTTKLLSILLAAIVLFASFPVQTEAATVKLNKTKVSLRVGNTTTIKLTGTNKEVFWESNRPDIATVSKNGNICGKKAGTTTITAGVGGKVYSCKVTVKKPEINATKQTIYVGKTYTLELGATSIKSAKSSSKSVATVNKKGVVTAKKVGKATITLTGKNGKKYSCDVVVKKAKKKYDGYDQWGNGYVLKYDNSLIKEGEKVFDTKFPVKLLDIKERYVNQETGEVYFGFYYTNNSTSKYDKALTEGFKKYTSKVSGVRCGIYNGVEVWFARYVATDPEISKDEITIATKESQQLKVLQTNRQFTWSSSNKKVATVTSKGKVIGKGIGKATIYAKADNVVLECKVSVVKPYLNSTVRTIYLGKSYTLKLKGTDIKSIKSSNTKVATVSKTGKVTAKKKGTALITIKGTDNKTYKCKVTVRKAARKYQGYDEFGNGYVMGEDGARHFDSPCPYPLYKITTYKGDLGLKGEEGYFAYGPTNVDRDQEYMKKHPEVWDMIGVLSEKYSTSHGSKEVGWYPDTLYVKWQGYSN